MHYTKITVLLSIFLIIGFGCVPKDNSSTATPPKDTKPSTETTAKPEPKPVAANPYLITDKSFMGLSSGNGIEEHADVLEQGVLKSGEGEFEVYNIKSESGEKLGYIMASHQDPSKIGNITITHPKASTEEGISIGATFAELESALGEVAVHGSEIESRTYAYKGHLAFLLDDYHNTYELDKSKVKKDAKIKEIEIRTNAYSK
ncbi:MAG: hypothetical protein AB8B69_01390 [Chitinophagales bacterium]